MDCLECHQVMYGSVVWCGRDARTCMDSVPSQVHAVAAAHLSAAVTAHGADDVLAAHTYTQMEGIQ